MGPSTQSKHIWIYMCVQMHNESVFSSPSAPSEQLPVYSSLLSRRHWIPVYV